MSLLKRGMDQMRLEGEIQDQKNFGYLFYRSSTGIGLHKLSIQLAKLDRAT